MTAVAHELRSGIRPTDSPLVATFNEGRLAFMRDIPQPPRPADDGSEQGTQKEAFWLGWMLERGNRLIKEIKRREAVRDYIERGDDLPPDFI